MSTNRTYYLAGSFIRRQSLQAVRARIADAFPNWDCSARWLDIESESEEDMPTIALVDAHDVLRSDALVFVRGQPNSPGKHTELGLAIAAAIPVHVVTPEWTAKTEREPCIFLKLVASAMPLEDWLRSGRLDTTPTMQAHAEKLLDAITFLTDGGDTVRNLASDMSPLCRARPRWVPSDHAAHRARAIRQGTGSP